MILLALLWLPANRVGIVRDSARASGLRRAEGSPAGL